MIAPRKTEKTSAQIAIEDNYFRELFGDIWQGDGYLVQSDKEYAWAILYREVMLQAVSDFIGLQDTEQWKRVSAWMNGSSPFNDQQKRLEIRLKLDFQKSKLLKRNKQQKRVQEINSKYNELRYYVDNHDPFDFEVVCAVLGLSPVRVRSKCDNLRVLGSRSRLQHTSSNIHSTISDPDDILNRITSEEFER
jgi:hypothetical protein